MAEIWNVAGLRLTLRPLVVSDIAQVVSLVSGAMWPTSMEEQKMMLETDPGSYTGLFLDDGTLVSFITLHKQSDELTYLGTYLTSTPYRGRGIGRKLFDHALEVSRPCSIVLDSVVGMVAKYEQSGFVNTGMDVHKVSGRAGRKRIELDVSTAPGIVTRRVTVQDLDDVCRYDRSVVGHDRARFMRLWLASAESVVVLAENLQESRQLCGYIAMRRDYIGCKKSRVLYKGAGFYADSPEIASQLLRDMFMNHLPPDVEFWFLYPTQNEHTASQVFTGFGETERDESFIIKRMIKGNIAVFDECNWMKIYSVANTFNVTA